MHGLLLWVVIYFGISFLVLPLLILFQQKMAAEPQFLAPDLNALAPDVTGFLYGAARELAADGFDEPTFLAMPNQVANVKAYLVMLINRATGDKAMVTAMFATPQNAPPTLTRYVEFSTRYENEQIFNTLNSKTLGSFRPSPKTVRTQTPSVQDVHTLYQLHRFVMDKNALGGPKVLYRHGEAMPYLQKAMIESYDQQVKYGILCLDTKANCYRPTVVGAYRMTWGLLWPVKPLRTMMMEREARRVLLAFDAATPASGMAY